MHALLLTTVLLAAAQPDTVVVCPADFREILAPWLDHRRTQGHSFAFVSNEQSPAEIRAEIRSIAAQSGRLRFVVLIGDDDPTARLDPQRRAYCVPAHKARAKVNIYWGSEPDIATDNWYGDLDGDTIPDLAVGRLTADNRAQLSVMVAKILQFEKRAPGGWTRRINVVAGVGGFGALADKIIETAATRFLTDKVPAGYDLTMTYGSWRSPYCPDPRRFREETISRYNEGGAYWVYLGHGQRRHLDRVLVPGGSFPIFDVNDIRRLNQGSQNPIAVLLACYTGAFDERRDCISEELLRSGGGPVAVLSGSRVTMPYAMGVMSNALLDQIFADRCETLGEAVLIAKQQMAGRDKESDSYRKILDGVARMVSPAPKLLDHERLEHVLLFNLFGDPLLRIPQPSTFSINVPEATKAGGEVIVQGELPIPGECQLELVCRRDQFRQDSPMRSKFLANDLELASYSETYLDSNDRRWTVQKFVNDGLALHKELRIPGEAYGNCFVRVWIQGSATVALATAPIFVRNEAKEAAKAKATDPF